MMLVWKEIPVSPDTGVVLYEARVVSSTDPRKSYRVGAVNGIVLYCSCPRFHFALNPMDVCSHRILAQMDNPPVVSGICVEGA